MAEWTTTKLEKQTETSDAGHIHCYDCGKKTRHDVLAAVKEESETQNGEVISSGSSTVWEMWTSTNYEIIKGRGCDGIAFRMRSRFSEDTDIVAVEDGYGGYDYINVPTERIQIYPRKIGSISFLDSRYVPEKIKRIHAETCSAIAYDNKVLAGIGLRAIVETLCKENGAAGKDLKEKIDNLVTIGILAPQSAVILHGIRFLGNKAAHEVEAESAENIQVALEIAETLIKQTHILPAKASTLTSPP